MADNQYKIKSYKIQRTYYKTSKYTLTLFIPPVEALEVQNGYNVNPNAILYLALPWNSETTHKRSIEIRVKNQRSILRNFSLSKLNMTILLRSNYLFFTFCFSP